MSHTFLGNSTLGDDVVSQRTVSTTAATSTDIPSRVMKAIDNNVSSETPTTKYFTEGVQNETYGIDGEFDDYNILIGNHTNSSSGEDHTGGKNSSRYDTYMLVISCVGMIVFGLILRKIFVCLTHARQTREKYHGGMKQLAEHMNVVTHSMEQVQPSPAAVSAEPSSYSSYSSSSPSSPARRVTYDRTADRVSFQTGSGSYSGSYSGSRSGSSGSAASGSRTESRVSSPSDLDLIAPADLFKPTTRALQKSSDPAELGQVVTQVEARKRSSRRIQDYLETSH